MVSEWKLSFVAYIAKALFFNFDFNVNLYEDIVLL